jgi:hypothetical protein
MTDQQANAVALEMIRFLETGIAPEGLFAADVFCDFTPPLWRVQTDDVRSLVELRRHGHPTPSKVTRWRCDPTPTGFVLEFEEEWSQDGRDWWSREMLRADVAGQAITNLSVFCTGDWSTERRTQHARDVRLLRA